MTTTVGSLDIPGAGAAAPPHVRDYLAVSAAMITGHLGPISQPYQIATLIEAGGAGQASAGLFLGVEIAFYAAALMLVARFVTRINLRTLALAGAALSLFAFLFAKVAIGGAGAIPAAALIGIGQGMIFATSIAAASRASEPEKVVGVAGMVALIFFALFMAVTPLVQERWGAAALFVELALFGIAFAPALLLLPAAGAPPSPRGGRIDGQVIRFVVQLLLYGAASGAVYAFMERMGTAAGATPRINGLILMLGILLGAAGSALAWKIGHGWGRVVPLLLALAGVGLSSLLMASGWGLALFILGVAIYQIFYSFAYPYLLGAAMHLHGGGLASFAGGFIFLASAAGAPLAGWLVEQASYAALGIAAFAACLLTAVLMPSRLRDEAAQG